MRLTACCIFLFLTGISFAQSESKTEILTEKVERNLERLENSYLVKLNKRDYSRAKDILDNVYSLLNELRTPEILPIDESSFRKIKKAIEKEPFSSNKINIIETAAERNRFTIHQLIDIIELLNYSDERIKVVDIIYPWVIDKNNSLLIFNVMKFSSEKEEVKKIIERYQ